jgi:acyl-CoA synthetase (AMP-forming)/AMP-acid ligase II
VPLTLLPPTARLIRDALQEHAGLHGSRPAVIDAHAALTFGQLWEQARTRATALGPRPGVIVAVPAASTAAFLVEVAATWLRGAVPMPVDSKAPQPLIHAMMRQVSLDTHTCQPWKVVLSVAGGTYRPLITGGESPTQARKANAIGLGTRPGGVTGAAGSRVALFASPMHLNGPFEFATRHLLLGGTVALLDRFDPGRWTDVCAALEPGWVFLAPIQIARLLGALPPHRLRTSLACVDTLLHSAAPCPAAVRRRLLELVDPHIVAEFYGAAEYDGTFARADEPTDGDPIPGAQLRVVDPAGQPVPPGTAGVIEGRSAAGLRVHYAGEHCDRASHWRTVGDHGVLDASGRLTVTDVDTAGRAIVGGVNVALSRVHAVLNAHPAVTSCQVIPVTDTDYGHVVAARITARTALPAEAVDAYCATHLRPAERPRRLHITVEQPSREEQAMRSACDLCAAIDPAAAGGPLAQHLRPGQQHIVARTPFAAAVPTIGAFVPGYLLIVPVTHSTSIGRLPRDQRLAVHALTEQVADRLAAVYDSPVLGFEYGLNAVGVRRIEHGHQHLLPSAAAVDLRRYLRWRLPLIEVDSMEHLPTGADRSYISVYEPGRPLSVYPVANDAQPRIRLREVIAQFDPRVPSDGWDWQQHPCTELMRATIDALTVGNLGRPLTGSVRP